jgi:hypothetical protein
MAFSHVKDDAYNWFYSQQLVMVSKINIKTMNVKRCNQVVQDQGYVIANQPLLGQHQ